MVRPARVLTWLGIVAGLALIAVLLIPSIPHSWWHRHPVAEPVVHSRRMFDGALAYYERTGAFPKSSPLTPPTRACTHGVSARREYAHWRHPTWQALRFKIDDPFHYQYVFVSDGKSFTARALGDLDCDGVLSTFERIGMIDAEGNFNGGAGIYKKDPLE